MAGSSCIREDVTAGLGCDGLPTYGPSFAAVWSVRGGRGKREEGRAFESGFLLRFSLPPSLFPLPSSRSYILVSTAAICRRTDAHAFCICAEVRAFCIAASTRRAAEARA